jgi:hypothetical protein
VARRESADGGERYVGPDLVGEKGWYIMWFGMEWVFN